MSADSGERKIPKIIHYCWFGGNPLPAEAKKCIDSWIRFFPGYEIRRWDESNFDITSSDYAAEAYADKKWAYVSDYARFYILYKYGGVYFDTDVEVIRSFDDILANGPFMGEENNAVNPGLGVAVAPGLGVIGDLLECYKKLHYKDKDFSDEKTIVDYTTEALRARGFLGTGNIERVDGITIYPAEFFCPMDYATGEITLTEHTHSIHHYTSSWLTPRSRRWVKMEQRITCKIGPERAGRVFNNHIWAAARMLYGRGVKELLRFVKRHIELRSGKKV